MAKENQAATNEATIIGFVEEIELENGDSGIQIDGDDYQYQVVMDKQGKKLFDHVDEEVEVLGTVSKNKGVRQLKVSRFSLLDSYEYDDEDYDDYDDYDD